jgi:hypothetical protein
MLGEFFFSSYARLQCFTPDFHLQNHFHVDILAPNHLWNNPKACCDTLELSSSCWEQEESLVIECQRASQSNRPRRNEVKDENSYELSSFWVRYTLM